MVVRVRRTADRANRGLVSSGGSDQAEQPPVAISFNAPSVRAAPGTSVVALITTTRCERRVASCNLCITDYGTLPRFHKALIRRNIGKADASGQISSTLSACLVVESRSRLETASRK